MFNWSSESKREMELLRGNIWRYNGSGFFRTDDRYWFIDPRSPTYPKQNTKKLMPRCIILKLHTIKGKAKIIKVTRKNRVWLEKNKFSWFLDSQQQQWKHEDSRKNIISVLKENKCQARNWQPAKTPFRNEGKIYRTFCPTLEYIFFKLT